MGKLFETIDDRLATFIRAQKIFFVASAPLSGDGHINLSPKGLDSFRILGPTRVAYLDLTGSGIETLAHVEENGRIVIMFCAFEGAARILRLYGRGESHQKGSTGFARLKDQFPEHPGARAIIEIELTRIADSCGWGVPLFDFKGERDQLTRALSHKSETDLEISRIKNNAHSIDGLMGYRPAG